MPYPDLGFLSLQNSKEPISIVEGTQSMAFCSSSPRKQRQMWTGGKMSIPGEGQMEAVVQKWESARADSEGAIQLACLPGLSKPGNQKLNWAGRWGSVHDEPRTAREGF